MSIHKKIVEIMKSVEYLKKDDEVGFGSSKYKAISEEKVTRTIREQFTRLGVMVYPIKQEHRMVDYDMGLNAKGNPTTNHMAIVDVTYRMTDVDDDTYIDICSSGTGVDTQDKAVGKAMTYAYKYMLLRTFAIPTGEDPDKISSNEIDDKLEKDQAQIVETINSNLRQKLYKLGGVKGVKEVTITKLCKRDYGTELKYITLEQYDELYEKFKALPEKEVKQ